MWTQCANSIQVGGCVPPHQRPDYSLIESTKLNGLDPQNYLTDVLARIADHPARRISEVLPWNWTLPTAKLAA